MHILKCIFDSCLVHESKCLLYIVINLCEQSTRTDVVESDARYLVVPDGHFMGRGKQKNIKTKHC